MNAMDITLRILVYLALMNICGFALFGIDKAKAVKRSWRIPEQTLFIVCAMGGCFGSLTGMYLFHHKTRKTMFRFGIPFLCIARIALIIWMCRMTF